MNLHDIPARRITADPIRSGQTLRAYWDEYLHPFQRNRAYEPVNTRDTFSVDDIYRAWSMMNAPRRQDRALQVIGEIGRFRDRLFVAGLREEEFRRNIAYTVTREDYRALQDYVATEGGYRGPTYEVATGTMYVMGVRVVPTR